MLGHGAGILAAPYCGRKMGVLTESNDSIKLAKTLEDTMLTFTANEAKTRFGEFLDRAQREPVGVLKHDRMVGVMVSVQDFAAMRTFYADRLQHNLRNAARLAEAAGMTPDTLATLLADES